MFSPGGRTTMINNRKNGVLFILESITQAYLLIAETTTIQQ